MQSRMSLRMLAAIVVLIPSSVPALDYYVNKSTGNDANDGRSVGSPWRTISRVNAHDFQPGDTIHLRRGQTWREALTVTGSGTATEPIVYTAYGSGDRPMLSGADEVTQWEHFQGMIYRVPVVPKPIQVFEENVRMKRAGGEPGSIAPDHWCWSDGFLYINVGSDPAQSRIEATRGDLETGKYGVLVIERDHVVVDGIRVEKFTTNVFVTGHGGDGSDSVSIRNCRLKDAYYHGIHGWDDVLSNDDVTITHNLVETCGGVGINWTKFADGGVISHNTVVRNGQLSEETTGDEEHVFPAGIKLWGQANGIANVIVEHNVVEWTGIDRDPLDGDGTGIWVDRTLGGNVIRYNIVRRNAHCGVLIEDGDYGGMIYYNVVHHNGGVQDPARGFGLLLMRGSQDWHVYNNTIVANAVGVGMGNWIGDGVPDFNVFANNIVHGNDTREVHVVHGAEVASNSFEFNYVHEHPGFVRWGSDFFASIPPWETVADPIVNSTVGGDPEFVDSDGNDYHVHLSSPCTQAGVDVGLEVDIEGVPVSSTPNMGAYETPYEAIDLFDDGFDSGDTDRWNLVLR